MSDFRIVRVFCSVVVLTLALSGAALADHPIYTTNGMCWENDTGFIYGCTPPPVQPPTPQVSPGEQKKLLQKVYQQGVLDEHQREEQARQDAMLEAERHAQQQFYQQREAVAKAASDREVEEGQREGAYWAAQREQYEAQQRAQQGLSNQLCRFKSRDGSIGYGYCSKDSKPSDVVVH